MPGSLLHQGGEKHGHFHGNLENHLNLQQFFILPKHSSPSTWLGRFLQAHSNPPTSSGPHLTLLQHPPSTDQPVPPSHRERLPPPERCIHLPSPLLLSVQMSPLYSSLETHRKIRLTTETDTPKKLSNTYSANDVFYQTTESAYYSPSQLELHKTKS